MPDDVLPQPKPRIVVLLTDRSEWHELLRGLNDLGDVSVCLSPLEAEDTLRDRPQNLLVVDCDEPVNRDAVARIRGMPFCADVPVLGVALVGAPAEHLSAVGIDVVVDDASGPRVLPAARALITDDEDVYETARLYDPTAELLVNDPVCRWVRSRLGIVGATRVRRRVSSALVPALLDMRIAFCHQLVDDLPDTRLRPEDLWNLILFLGVPWSEDEIRVVPELALALLKVAGTMSGSRKIILFGGMHIRDELAPIGLGSASWAPSSQEPLRDAILSVMRTDAERGLIEMFFKKRIPEEDLEQLIRTLGRQE